MLFFFFVLFSVVVFSVLVQDLHPMELDDMYPPLCYAFTSSSLHRLLRHPMNKEPRLLRSATGEEDGERTFRNGPNKRDPFPRRPPGGSNRFKPPRPPGAGRRCPGGSRPLHRGCAAGMLRGCCRSRRASSRPEKNPKPKGQAGGGSGVCIGPHAAVLPPAGLICCNFCFTA